MNNIRLALALVLLHIFNSGLSPIEARVLDIRNSLINEAVNCISQDCNGHIWIGTHSGIVRYDGCSFKRPRTNSETYIAIEGNINDILKDSRGTMWFATDNGIARLFHGETDFSIYSPIYPAGGNSIQTLSEDKFGNVWAGTKEYGLIIFGYDEISDEHPEVTQCGPDVLSCDKVWSVAPDGNGIWAGTENGLNYVEYVNGVVSAQKYFTHNSNLPGNIIKRVHKDSKGNIFLSIWDKGVYLFKPEIGSFKYICPYSSSMVSDSGYVWIATKREGIYVIDSGTLKTVRHFSKDARDDSDRIPSDYCTSVFKDESGLIWVSFYDYGICLIPEFTINNRTYLPGKNISSLLYDEGILWATTRNSLLRIDPVSGISKEFIPDNHDKDAGLGKITKAKDPDILLMGSYGEGIYLFDKVAESFTNINREASGGLRISNDYVNVAIEDSKGNIWSGTWGTGIERINHDGKNHESGELYSLSNDVVTAICEDCTGRIWAGTKNGGINIFTYDSLSRKYSIKSYKNTPGDRKIKHNSIRCFFPDSKGILWIGTERGIEKYDISSDSFVDYKWDEMPSRRIENLYQSKDSTLWILTERRLISVDKSGDTRYLSYSIYSDSPVNTAAFCVDDEMNLYLGTSEGILRISNRDMKDNESIAHPVRIADIRIGNNNMVSHTIGNHLNPADSVLRLSYDNNSFTISYSSTDYLMLEDQRYSYKLDGYDKDWFLSDNSSKNVTYSNLPEGKYTFIVKSTYRNGKWNSSTSRIHIEVTPPWYRSAIAYALYAVITSLLIILCFKAIKWKIHTEHKAELHATRMNYFIRIARQFLNPLTLIIGPARKVMSDRLAADPEIRNNLTLIDNNARLIHNLIHEILELGDLEYGKTPLKIAECDISVLLSRISGEYRTVAEDRGIKFSDNIEPGITGFWDKRLIERFITNIMSFSFKSTPPNGSISLSMENFINSENKRAIRISMGNDGSGIPEKFLYWFNSGISSTHIPDSLLQENGLDVELLLARTVSDMHHGRLTVKSKEWTKTIFSLEICIERSEYGRNEMNDNIYDSDYRIPEFVPDYEHSQVELYGRESKTGGDIALVCLSKEMSEFLASSLKDYNIVVFNEKNSALKYILDRVPDIVLIDDYHNDRIMDEICPVIKEDMRTRHIQLVALTDRGSMEDKMRIFSMGYDLCLEKPFTAEYLRLRIRKLFEHKMPLNKDDSSTEYEDSAENEFITKVYDVVQRNMSDSSFNIDAFTREMGISRTSLHLKLKEYTSYSANEFIRNCRLKRASELLAKGGMNIDEVCYAVGFNTPSYFTKCFREYFGILPNEYRAKKQ